MIINSSTKLQAITSDTPSAALTFYIDYVDIETSSFAVAGINATDGTFDQTITDILAAPASGSIRQVKGIRIYNASTGRQEVTLYANVGGTQRVIQKLQVSTLGILIYIDGKWQESEIAVIGSDALTLSGRTSNPATPGANTMLLYNYPIAGRQMLRMLGASGLDTAMQPAFFGNGIIMIAPYTSTTFTVFGTVAPTNVGTVSHPALVAGNLRSSTRRAQILSSAVINSASETRIAYASVWRGNAAGLGGFFYRARFAYGSNLATQRLLVGLTSSTGATVTTQDPATLFNCLFIGNGLLDTNLQIMVNDGAGVCTQVDMGSNFPKNEMDAIYDVTFFCGSNSSEIGYTVTKLNTGDTVSGTLTTDLPASNTFLAPHVYLNNGGTAAAVTLDIMRIYIETDQ